MLRISRIVGGKERGRKREGKREGRRERGEAREGEGGRERGRAESLGDAFSTMWWWGWGRHSWMADLLEVVLEEGSWANPSVQDQQLRVWGVRSQLGGFLSGS